MKPRLILLLLMFGLQLGCAKRAHPVALPPPVHVTAIGVGDVFTVVIVGEKDLPTEFTVAPDGTVDIPYIHRQKVAGLEPQEISDLVRQQLTAKNILSNPSVSVSVTAYNSKRVEVLGEVKKPGSLPLEPGMTLLRAISQAGGFNSLANKGRVTIRRQVAKGTKAAVVDIQAIIENRIPDVLLQAGDTIVIPERAF